MDEDKISVSELRQWRYCPRVVWHGRWLGHQRPTTFRMEEGKEDEAVRDKLEERRTFHAYGIDAINKKYRVYMHSPVLGLAGIVDMVIELTQCDFFSATNLPSSEQQLFVPVEFKSTQGNIGKHHLVQLGAYGMMIEDLTASPVRYGFIVQLPSGRPKKIEIDAKMRADVLTTLDAIRESFSVGLIPPPTSQRGKCTDCEFKRFCNDIW